MKKATLSTLSAALLAASFSYSPIGWAENVLNVVPHAPLRTLDPLVSTANIVRTHGFMVFDTLVGMDSSFQPQPQMADFTVSDDKLIYTFTLRDGLLWHDGTPVTAEDCVASLHRWAAHDTAGKRMMALATSLEATSDREFVLTMSEPFGLVLELLAKPSPVPAFMMPRRLAETPSGEQVTEMIGSGPFRFIADEYRPGDQVVYERFTDYTPRAEAMDWTAGGKQVKVDKVVWKNMPDMQTALNALQAGDVDYVEQVAVDLLPLLDMNPDIATGRLVTLGSQMTGQFNHRIPPFDDVKVRQAAILAMDQDLMMRAAFGDPKHYTLCTSVYGCDVPLASDAGAEYYTGTAEDRMKKAQELLKDSSYDGRTVLIMQPTDVAILNTQPIVAAERLREAGFKVQVTPMDWGSLQARKDSWKPVEEGGWNLFFTFWGVAGIWNPLVNMLIDGTGEDNTWAGWRVSPEIEVLRQQYVRTTDAAEQKKIARDIQQIANDQGFYFNGGEFGMVAAWRNEVKDLQPGPLSLYWGVHK